MLQDFLDIQYIDHNYYHNLNSLSVLLEHDYYLSFAVNRVDLGQILSYILEEEDLNNVMYKNVI